MRFKFSRPHQETRRRHLILSSGYWIVSYSNTADQLVVWFLSDTADKGQQEVVRRLDALINVLFETAGKNGIPVPMVTRIKILHNVGMRPVEISKILGKKITYINNQLSRIRKGGSE